MSKISKKVSALVFATMFASMQISNAAVGPAALNIDTGLGIGNGGAVIQHATSGFVGVDTSVPNTATLNFNGSTQLIWDRLNVNKGETLNFNAVNGANGLTVVNQVNGAMSKIYGQINANQGISKLIISNPNGVLFDGAKFTTAGDTIITTQQPGMYWGEGPGGMTVKHFYPGPEGSYTPDGQNYMITVKNSNFTVGGELNFLAPTMNVVKTAFKVGKNGTGDVRFTTTNGQDYFVTQSSGCDSGCCSGSCGDNKKYTETQSMRLEAIQVDGNVYITSDKGIVKTVNGGQINGNLNVKSDGSVTLNYVNNDNKLNVTGDVNVEGNGPMMYARVADIKGNLNMENGGGFLEVNDVTVGKNMNLTTTAKSENPLGYKHFTHVNGYTKVGGDATINSENNIHIGNYNFEEKRLLDGNLEVGGKLTAHANNGHVMTTIDVQADKIDYTSDKLNVLTDDKSVLTANEYSFKANGYIGGLKQYTKNCKTYTTADQVIDIMENYRHIPQDIQSHAYTQIAGGKITNIEAPKNSQVYIGSKGDVIVTGANAGDINITAYRKRIDVQGPNVHANNINVGPETDYLKLEFEGRDFTTNYTNIKDGKVVTIRPDEEITYELADGNYNQPTLKPDENTTYLIGPGKKPTPTPPNSKPKPVPDDDNVRVKNWVPDDPMKPLVNTPVAYAADLDDEDGAPCRKNVDGSVTVVRAIPMMGD